MPGLIGTIGLVSADTQDVTVLLRAWGRGDEASLHALIPLVERELKKMPRSVLRNRIRAFSPIAMASAIALTSSVVTRANWNVNTYASRTRSSRNRLA